MTTIRNRDNVLIQKDVWGREDIDLAQDLGQNGFEIDMKVMANSTPHVQNPARIVVTRTPGWMDRHPDKDRIKSTFTYLIETHAESWTGFNIESTINVGERAAGWDGQLIKAPTTRLVTPIQPQATYKAIGEGVDINYWNYYMDVALVSSQRQAPDFGEFVDIPDSWTLLDYTFDVLVWEPNSTFTRARWAMAVAGMWPSTPVPINMDRNVADARKIREYTMSFEGGVYDCSEGVIDAATALEVALNVNRIKNSTKASFFTDHTTQIETEVKTGLLEQITAWPDHDPGTL